MKDDLWGVSGSIHGRSDVIELGGRKASTIKRSSSGLILPSSCRRKQQRGFITPIPVPVMRRGSRVRNDGEANQVSDGGRPVARSGLHGQGRLSAPGRLAGFAGSMGGRPLNAPIVGMAA